MKKYIKSILTSLIIVMLLGNVALAEEEYELPLDEVTGYGVELTEEEQASYEASLFNDASSEDEYELLGAGIPTEEEAYQSMIALQSQYPERMRWTNDNYYGPFKGGIYSGGYGCAGFAFALSDAAFGSLRARIVYDMPFSDVHVGDILRINSDSHSVIVMERYATYLVLAEGNYNSSIHWGRRYTASEYAANITYVMTRYPEGYFSDSPVCSIAFDANGGTGEPAETNIDKNTAYTIPTQVPTKNFSTFLGWSEQPGATTADYLPGRTYSFSMNTILYAVWQLNYVTASGKTPVNLDTSVGSGGVLFKFVPERTDEYTFVAKTIRSGKWFLHNANMFNSMTATSTRSDGSRWTFTLTEGNTYYIGFLKNDGTTDNTSFTLNITGANDGNDPVVDLATLLECYYTSSINLSLYETNKISMNCYVAVPEALDVSKAKYSFAVNGNTLATLPFTSDKIEKSDTVSNNGISIPVKLYKVTVFIPVTGLGDDVELTLYYDNNMVNGDTFSVCDYADKCINKSSAPALEKKLLKKLLNYGAYSQLYFAKKTDKLANTILTDADKAISYNRNLFDYKYSMFDMCDSIDYLGSSVVLQSDFAIKHYFSIDDKNALDDYNIMVDGEKVIPEWVNDNVFCVVIYNIDISQLRDSYITEISNDNYEIVKLNYSVMSYFERALDRKNDKDDLSNLVYSVLDYEEAFNNLFK